MDQATPSAQCGIDADGPRTNSRRTFKLRREMQSALCGHPTPPSVITTPCITSLPDPTSRHILDTPEFYERTVMNTREILPYKWDFYGRYAARKTILGFHLDDLRSAHRYIVHGSLFAARMGIQACHTYDNSSHFTNIKMVVTNPTNLQEPNIEYRPVYMHTNRSVHTLVISPTSITHLEPVPKIPKYRFYRTLKTCALGNNNNLTRYFPRPAELREQSIPDERLQSLAADSRIAEMEARTYELVRYYEGLLPTLSQEQGVNAHTIRDFFIGRFEQTIGYDNLDVWKIRREALSDDIDPTAIDPRNSPNEIPLISAEHFLSVAPTCKAFKELTNLSIWHMVQSNGRALSTDKTLADGSAVSSDGYHLHLSPRLSTVHETDTGKRLICPECFIYSCPLRLKHHSTNTQSSACSGGPDANENRSSLSHVFHRIDSVLGASKECSPGCFIRTGEGSGYHPSYWSPEDSELLETSAKVLSGNPRFSCLMTAIFNKPCWDIYSQLILKHFLKVTPFLPTRTARVVRIPTVKRGRKAMNPARWLPGYPANCDLAHRHDKRSKVTFCGHAGICTSGCPCVDSHVNCEKFCTCPPECPRRWRGCTCKKKGRTCSTYSCICFKANRECDPELCVPCGAPEVVLEINRYSTELHGLCCQNIGIQIGVSKRTLLGISAVAGMGLFIGEHVRKGEYLGEYMGELIEEKEANHRASIDKTYMFNLNQDQILDSIRAGNKFRFINHSADKPNVKPKVLIANYSHRIGLYATKKLLAGEELFFDYGYHPGMTIENQDETEVSNFSNEVSVAQGRPRRANHGKSVRG